MELHTSIYNQATPAKRVLLVGPSLGGNVTHQWTKVAAELIDEARIVFIDLPGSGLAEPWADGQEPTLDTIAAAIAEIARAQKRELGEEIPVYFAGLSISGATGLHLARDYPELFAGIIVVASAATVGEPARWLERAAQVEATGTQQLVEETTKRWFTAGFRAEQGATVDIIMEGLSVAEDQSYAQLCRALAAHDVRDDLPYLQTPLMMIAGSRDSSTPIENVELVAETAPRGELHIVDGAAHLVPVMRPVEVAALIAKMMDRPQWNRVVSESSD